MGRTYDALDDGLATFLRAQHVFFVSTAPSNGGHVNLSPKGLDTFAVLDPHTVAYLDLTGSGVETIAHLRENGRITICFCAFDGAPRIVRLYGCGTAIEPGDAAFAALRSRFGRFDAVRSIIRVALTRIADSCDQGAVEYRRANNRASIDGLPGLRGDG